MGKVKREKECCTKEHWRKWAAFGLAAILAAALAGCGGKAEETAEKNKKASSILMKDAYDRNDNISVLRSELSRESIVSVTFLDTLKDMPDTAWDVSWEQDRSVMAWTKKKMGDKYALFIGAEGGVAVKDCNGLFGGYTNMKKIEFNHCFDTSGAENMHGMFYDCMNLAQLDVSGFDTGHVTDMRGMFDTCGITAE